MTFYLTTPIYYVNATPHLGHAYTTILADAMCRYRRLAGEEVFFLTGTDEHGDKIAQAAAAAGEAPQAYADRIASAFRETWKRLGISYDDFIRTTEERHKQVVRAILARLHETGEIYFGEYGGNYCFGCERFYTDKELVGGKCPDHRTAPTYIKEHNYFFRMSRYQDWLVRHIEERPDFIRPERYRNEVLGFLREPLEDLCISRPKSRLQWGIPFPFDDRYVTYVWFDALINYVSAIGYPDTPGFRERWANAQHLIGKDILKPHAVYWPCMLKAVGLPVYQHLNVHGYWSLGGGKMSKSIGNVVEALALAEKYGNDAFRYFVMREMPFGLDASFSEEAFVGRLNADLANDLGNLVSRATTLIASFNGGRLPAPDLETAPERGVAEAWGRARDEVSLAIEEFAFQRALGAIWEFIGTLNRYVDTERPWALAKDPAKQPRLRTVLHTLGEALRCLGIILEPFLPDAAGKIRQALGLTSAPRLDSTAEWGWVGSISAQKAPAIFPRVEEEKAAPGSKGKVGVGTGRITIDDFSKVDLRVAEIVAAEPVSKSKKLLKLTVEVGAERRTLVAGIAEHYDPASLIGKKVIVVANLEPATLMGIESNGMVLAASDGSMLSLLFLDRDLPPGSPVT